jgi:hypothetical protein
MLPVTQYNVRVVSSSSKGNERPSLHARNFSTIQAARPAGESTRP